MAGRISPLHSAAARGSVEDAARLIDEGADLNQKDPRRGFYEWSPLHHAVRFNRIKMVRFLLDRNALVNVKDTWGSTPLHYAAFHNYLSISELLVRYGANVHVQNVQCSYRNPLLI
eukprot:c8899_g1_i1.p1 GENE.c8899_g1_i1~~c8899_g1_i1.p1  ORF type:complete len:125 (-),score=12.59 c8899_g1_i1:569-916(-)